MSNRTKRGRSYGQDDDDDSGKDPVRVQAGKKAVANRSHEELSEQGRKGGLARGQRNGSRGNKDFDVDKYGHGEEEEDDDDDDQEMQNGNGNSRQAGGNQRQSGGGGRGSGNQGRGRSSNAGKRFITDPEEDDFRPEDVEEDEGESLGGDFAPGKNRKRQQVGRRIAAPRGHDALAEQGRKGGQSNAGIHADTDYDDMDSYRQDPDRGVPAKDPRRVRGGKRAAQSRDQDGLSEQGRRGGRANRGVQKFGGDSGFADDVDEEFTEKDAKEPSRVRGGLRAAAQQSHESFVERGRQGAAARFGNSNGSSRGQSGQRGQSQGGKQSGGQNQGRDSQGRFTGGEEDGGEEEEEEDHDDDNEDQGDEGDDNGNDSQGKNPNRVAGGKRAAAHFSHEELSERARRAAQSRVNQTGNLIASPLTPASAD